MTCDDDNAQDRCGNLVFDRLRYFTGRHMTARDFRDADGYHRAMRLLHNRLLHGWGVACGLDATLHPRPACGVVIACGLALDCCGREIVLPHAVAQPIPWDKLQAENGKVLVLCLAYDERLTEKVPVLYSNEACASAAYEDGRVREGYALHWHAVHEADLSRYGWQLPTGCPPGDDTPCAGPPDGAPARCCLDQDCPPDDCVALAVVRGNAAAPQVDTSGRRFIGPARDQLTHICWISWPHGGYISASQFRQVSVRFDRMLAVTPDRRPFGPTGINERTFVMQAGEQREDLDFVMYRTLPHLLDDRRTAQFDVIDPDDYIGHTVQVTLRCDFILDCHDNPVDGTHLRGRLPSGNGVMGGDFQSWFRVVRDDDYERMTDTARTGGEAP